MLNHVGFAIQHGSRSKRGRSLCTEPQQAWVFCAGHTRQAIGTGRKSRVGAQAGVEEKIFLFFSCGW